MIYSASSAIIFCRNRQYADDSANPQSLSIIYRRNLNTTKDKLVKTMKGSNQIVMDAGEDSLDLIIPSKSDFEALTRTLADLLAFYREEEPCANPDHAWIEYHLVDMGKSLANAPNVAYGIAGRDGGDVGLKVSCADWVALCKRWNAPVSKTEATAMYKAFCEGLATSNANAEGLEMVEVVRLLEVLRQRGLEACIRVEKGGERDPRRRLFQKLAWGGGGPSSRGGDPSREGAISAEEFLHFLRVRQKETDTTLQDVKDLFYQLNGHRVSPQLEDVISVLSGRNRPSEAGQGASEGEVDVSWEREYISWEAFGRYLTLESNDVFDPEKAELSSR